MKTINIGLTADQLKNVTKLLNVDLADTYLLLIKTKKFHWDVTGPQFRSLHTLWDEQYEALSLQVDAIAERIRMLGEFPLGTAKGFLDSATLEEEPNNIPTASGMVRQLQENHEQLIRNLRLHIDTCTDKHHDAGTADFLTGLMEQHEMMAWMLRSFLEGENIPSVKHVEALTDTQVHGKQHKN
jgi:starvation-inducible DNA-binding protein